MAKRLFLLTLLFFIACSNPRDYSSIKVLEVIDGDTVKLSSGRLLRYIGLDTPEVRVKKNGKFEYAPQPFSLEATEYNRKLVEGKSIRVEFDVVKKDKYGRLLGYCFVGDVFVNAELIKQGYATVYTWPPNVKYVDTFVALGKQARVNKKGLWYDFKTIGHSQAHLHINKVKAVRGEVVNTHKSKKCVYLNFGKNWRTDFTVVIFNDALTSFAKKGIDPVVFYKNKKVEVVGRIKEYNGPEIIVNSPSQIEVIE